MTRPVPLLVLAALLLATCGGSSTASSQSASPPAVLTMQQVEARTHGHPTVLLFTAQDCASCVATARALQDAAGGGSEVRLVGVDIDSSDTQPSLAAYVRAIGLQSSGFVWTIDSDNALARRYGITSLSSTVLLDSSGQARFVNQGPQDASTYAQQLSGLH
jgi:thiol-disulfide isomerase/thioredoxin